MTPDTFGLILDDRNGLGSSISAELQTEAERQVGVTPEGLPIYIYIDNTPQVIIKETYSCVGPLDAWNDLLSKVLDGYDSITTIPMGIFLESVNVGGGWFIIDGEDYYGGSYTVVDYSNLSIATLPAEFKITESSSASVAPSGYLPDGKGYYSSNQIGKSFSRNSVCSIEYANGIRVGQKNGPGFVTSKNFSNPRILNGKTYVDLSIEYINSNLTADITII